MIEDDPYRIYDLFLKSFGVRFKSILGLDCYFFNLDSVIIFFLPENKKNIKEI